MKYKRPRCENCGFKLFPKNQAFRKTSFLTGELPNHCPDCGIEITNAKKAELDEFSTKVYGIWCIGFISFVIIVVVIFTSIQNL